MGCSGTLERAPDRIVESRPIAGDERPKQWARTPNRPGWVECVSDMPTEKLEGAAKTGRSSERGDPTLPDPRNAVYPSTAPAPSWIGAPGLARAPKRPQIHVCDGLLAGKPRAKPARSLQERSAGGSSVQVHPRVL
jgi:hypothetical protein